MSRKTQMILAAALTAVAALAVAAPALAADSNIGDNLGNEVKSWGEPLLLGIAALVVLPALFKRDFGQSLVILLIVIVAGGFVYADDQVKDVIESIWNSVGAGAGNGDKPDKPPS
jgi:hypothetical protein